MDLDDDGSDLSALSDQFTVEERPSLRRSRRAVAQAHKQPQTASTVGKIVHDRAKGSQADGQPVTRRQSGGSGSRPYRSVRRKNDSEPRDIEQNLSDEYASEGEDAQSTATEDGSDQDFTTGKAPLSRKQAKYLASKKSVAPAQSRSRRKNGHMPSAGAMKGSRIATTRALDDFSINTDNEIFNAVQDANSALEGTVETWMELYQSSDECRGEALAQIVNFILRACGCNSSVDIHEVQDLDGAVSKLDDIQVEFATEHQRLYPLVSRSKQFKKFGSSLQEFIARLIDASASSGILFDQVFCETLQTWLVAGSTSKLRAFRHTSTVIVLLLEEALCSIVVSVTENLASLQRQRIAETAKTRSKKDKARLKEIENRIKATQVKKSTLDTYLKDLFDAVFVLRYRDSEPSIRVECIRALGAWMTKNPDYFLEGNYLRYTGWMLTDSNNQVRHEAVKSLVALYEKEDYINSMSHFTERFKARLLEMAISDIELAIRATAIRVLTYVDRYGLLEEEERHTIATLIFHAEPGIRKAVGPLFSSLLTEGIEIAKQDMGSLPVARKTAVEENQFQMKVLAGLLTRYSRHIDTVGMPNSQGTGHRRDRLAQDNSQPEDPKEILYSNARDEAMLLPARMLSISSTARELRIQSAVGSLWSTVEIVQNWQAILALLLLDHANDPPSEVPSSTREGRHQNEQATTSGSASRQTTSNEITDTTDQRSPLQSAEELVILHLLLASVKENIRRMSGSKINTEDQEGGQRELSLQLITAIPVLLGRFQTDPTKLHAIFELVQLVDLELYVDSRHNDTFGRLWDDLIKHYTHQSDFDLLSKCAETASGIWATQGLHGINENKLGALQSAVVKSLHDAVAGLDVENDILDDVAVKGIEDALIRIYLMLKGWKAVQYLELGPGTSQESAIAITMSVVERAHLAYENEEKMILTACEILYYLLLRKLAALASDSQTPTAVLDLRDFLVKQCKELTAGDQSLSSTSLDVKKTAWRILLDVAIICEARYRQTDDPMDRASLAVDTQYKCAGFLQAQIGRLGELHAHSAEDLQLLGRTSEEQETSSWDDKGRKDVKALAKEYTFNNLVATYARAVCTEVLDLKHAVVVLLHFGRFGIFYDEACTQVIEAVRFIGLYLDEASIAVGVVCDVLKGAIDMLYQLPEYTETHFLRLSKLLSNHIILRGRGFTVLKRLPSTNLVALHRHCLDWAFKRILDYEGREREVTGIPALVIFKALNMCLLGATGKEASMIHSHMNDALKEIALEFATDSDEWEGQRLYERKLLGAMSKDSSKPRRTCTQVELAAKTALSAIRTNARKRVHQNTVVEEEGSILETCEVDKEGDNIDLDGILDALPKRKKSRTI